MKHSLKTLILTLATCGIIPACTNTQIAHSEKLEIEAQQQASTTEITAEQAIEAASDKYMQAIADEMQFYAPLHLAKAEDKLKDARKLGSKIETTEDKQEVISLAFAANKLIDNAYTNKTVVLKELSNTLSHKDVLLQLNSDNIHPKDHQKALTKLDKLIREIEGGNIAKAKEMEVDTLKFYAELEAKTLKTTYLTKAITKLDEADSIDADEYAESTYKKAQAAIKHAHAFIEQSYRDREGVIEVSNKAYNQAAHAYHVANEASRLEKINKEEAEQFILKIESYLQRINQQAGVKNLSSMSLHNQAVALTKAFKNQEKNNQPDNNTEKTVELIATETKTIEAAETAKFIADDTANAELEQNSTATEEDKLTENASHQETPVSE